MRAQTSHSYRLAADWPSNRRRFSASRSTRQAVDDHNLGFPEIESATVRRLQELLGRVKQRHPGIVGTLPKRFNNQTWADFLEQQQQKEETRADHGSVSADTTQKRLTEMLAKPKRMHDSYIELQLPFASDKELLERYIATSGKLRLGKIFEDLDGLAGDSECLDIVPAQPLYVP